VEAILKTNDVRVRIDKPLVAGREHLELLEGASTDLSKRRRSVDELALDEDGNEHVLRDDGGAVGLRHVLGTGGIARINSTPGLLGLHALVPDDITGKEAVNNPTAGVEHTGVGHLDGHLAQLDARLPGGLTLFHGGSKLVNTTESRLVVAGDELCADAPHVDGSALVLQGGHEVLIEIVAGKDLCVGEASGVEHLAGFDTEPGKITAVQTDTSKLVAGGNKLLGGLDGLAHTGDGVVGIDEKHAVVGSGLGPAVEGLLLRGEALHPGVGVGTGDRDAVALASKNVGGCGAATDVSSTAGSEGTVQALSTAETKLEHGLAEARSADTSRLGGNEGAKVDHAEQGSLDELSLQDGTLHTNKRLEREDDSTLRNSVDIEGERAHVDEVLEESRVEEGLAVVALECGEVVDVRLGETQSVEPLNCRLETRADGVTTIERLVTIEDVEDGLGVGTTTLPVTLSHGQLIKIGQQAQTLHLVARNSRFGMKVSRSHLIQLYSTINNSQSVTVYL